MRERGRERKVQAAKGELSIKQGPSSACFDLLPAICQHWTWTALALAYLAVSIRIL